MQKHILSKSTYVSVVYNYFKNSIKQNPDNEKSRSNKVEASTNKKLHKLILKLLRTDKSVEVYGFVNKDLGQ